MKSNHYMHIAKNLLVGAGAYYLCRWLVVPLVFGFGRMTLGLIYSGDFNGKIVSQLVLHFPLALAVLIEADLPVYWAVFPAIFYGLLAFLGHHWVMPPNFLERVGQTLGALFPALTCAKGCPGGGATVPSKCWCNSCRITKQTGYWEVPAWFPGFPGPTPWGGLSHLSQSGPRTYQLNRAPTP